MMWQMIRLDLARSQSYPEGSHAHCYLIRLPLNAEGRIDPAALRANPGHATVLRSSPDAPERTGHVGLRDGKWVFSYAPGEDEDEQLFELETHALLPGNYLTITDASGEASSFQVISTMSAVPIDN